MEKFLSCCGHEWLLIMTTNVLFLLIFIDIVLLCCHFFISWCSLSSHFHNYVIPYFSYSFIAYYLPRFQFCLLTIFQYYLICTSHFFLSRFLCLLFWKGILHFFFLFSCYINRKRRNPLPSFFRELHPFSIFCFLGFLLFFYHHIIIFFFPGPSISASVHLRAGLKWPPRYPV